MNRLVRFRRQRAALVCAGLLGLASYSFFPGAPYWHLGFLANVHYKVDLPDADFPAGSTLEASAIASLDDWEKLGDTDLVTDYTKRDSDPYDNNNGRNTWAFGPLPAGTLGLTTTVWSGDKIKEADTIFNDQSSWVATGRYWVNNLLDPASTPPPNAISFRATARHEAGHAIGLGHDDGVLATMGSIYSHGSGAPHTAADGMLPHADDKAGCRKLYPAGATLTEHNLMATCWQEPPGTLAAAVRLASLTGTYVRGDPVSVLCYLENQGSTVYDIHVGVFLSADSSITTGDIQIADIAFSGTWPAYTHGTYDLPATLDAPGGDYYVGVIIDSTDIYSERWESDNAIEVGQVTIVEYDLAVTSFNISNLNPVRGDFVNVDITVRNLGATATPNTKVRVHLARNPIWGPVAGYDFELADLDVIPGLVSGEWRGVAGSVQVPPTLCAERTWYMYATVDPDDELPEIVETNNDDRVGFSPLWDKPGIQIGQCTTAISSSSSDPKYEYTVCSKAPGVPPYTVYGFLWTCSGTSPGIPMPPLGTLPLNFDSCTSWGVTLWSSLFAQLRGDQSSLVVTGTIAGDPILAPLSGWTTHFAAIYVDPVTGQLVGIAAESLAMTIR